MATAKKSSKTEKAEKPEKKKVKTKLKARKQEFNGKPTFSIWEVDEKTGENVKDFPVISFGLAKAKAILQLQDKLKKFVDELEAAENKEESSE